ncbi:MAG: S8 family serine peptidase [Saprospiraceae bacterium]
MAQESAFIKLTAGVSTSSTAQRSVSLQSILDQYGATISQAYPTAQTQGLAQWTRVECGACSVSDLIAEVQNSNPSDVEVAIVEQIAELTNCADCPDRVAYNDPLIQQNGTEHQISSLNSDCVEADHSDGETITIAIMDSEFDVDHPDLLGRLTSVNIDHLLTEPADQVFGHGTNVAGMIIANRNNSEGFLGNCTTCNVVGYTIDTDNGFINSDDFRTGGMAAMDDGHKVLSFSISSLGESACVKNFVEEAVARGVFILGASGNNNRRNGWDYGSEINDIPGFFVVSSSRPNPTFTYNRDDYTLGVHSGVANGPEVDFLGTGFYVTVATNPDTDNYTGYYATEWGTSQAVTSVAGVLGSVLSVNSCLSHRDMENLLKLTACSDITGYSALDHGAGVVDQAAAVSRARQYSDAAEYDQSASPLIIDEAVSWDSEFMSYNRQVIVKDGGFLTINGSQINFSVGAGITVESGGNLVARGSTFTYNRCGEYPTWNGISMNGSGATGVSGPARPGVFINGCTIEHATSGVSDHGLQQPLATDGGEVEVEFSEFLNCKTGVSFFRPTGAVPQVTGSTFELNDAYPFSSGEPRGVSVVESPPGVVAQILSNTFTDQRSDRSIGYTGVSVQNASFLVSTGAGPAGGSFGRTKFINCKNGVKAIEGLIDNHLAEIRDAESENTNISTWLLGYNGPLVVNNDFQAQSPWSYTDRMGAPLLVAGILIEHCRRYEVEGNTVTGGLTAFGQTYGIAIKGNAIARTRDDVYNNTLNSCNFGMWAEGVNGGADRAEGLCYECNTFNGCGDDVRAVGSIAALQQGRESGVAASAGNVFESSVMQFASLVTSVSYLRASLSEEPNPQINVFGVPTSTSNSCLPIFGFTGGEEPPCEEVDIVALDEDRETIKSYYETGKVSEKDAAVALSDYNKQYVMYAREFIDQVDDCENGSVVEWENTIKTAAPWQPLDEALIEVYKGDYGAASTKLEGLIGLAGEAEMSRLVTMLSLGEDLQLANSEDEVEAAYANADLLSLISDSELGQSYGQALARAAAASYGLVAYEAMLSGIGADEDGSGSDDQESLTISTPFELQDVTIFDALGRQLGQPNSGDYLTVDGLNRSLNNQPPGIYFVRGMDDQGSIHTVSVSNVK